MAFPKYEISYSPAEYLAAERESDERYEYLDGVIYRLAGESPEHSTITTNLIAALVSQVRGKGCRTFSPNMKVRTSLTEGYFYPDASVVCGEPRYHDDRRDVLTNPKVIIEILSPSTENYDRVKKFFRYQVIETLTDYVLIAQNEPLIELRTREADGRWTLRFVSGLDADWHLESIGCRLKLAEIYDLVTFPEPVEEPNRE